MPVNPYDDRKVSLRRLHGNGDLDIVGASYTRRKTNVTDVLEMLYDFSIKIILFSLLSCQNWFLLFKSLTLDHTLAKRI